MDALPPQILHKEPVAEVWQAPLRKNAFEIDPKNPVLFLKKQVSGSVSEIIHVANKGSVTNVATEKTGKLKENHEKEVIERKYKQLHEIIDKEEQVWNVDTILKQPRGKLLETHIYSLHWGKFDKDGNILLPGGKTLTKWTAEYNQKLERALFDFRRIWHALLDDAKERWQDPDTIRKLP